MEDEFYAYLQERCDRLEDENEAMKDELDVLYNVIAFMRDNNPDVSTLGVNELGEITYLFAD